MRLADAGVTRFHWDLADGSMSRAGGFSASAARALAPPRTTHEAHLMLADPRPVLADWASWCDAVAVHASQPHWREASAAIASAGALPVVAVTREDELAAVPAHCGVLVMAIAPGEAGGAFDEGAFDLVAAAANAGHPHVAVDGSMTPKRGRRFAAAGATVVVSGTGLTAARNPAAWVAAARQPSRAPSEARAAR